MENFDFNNIEKYLREGGDPESIAKAFADKLNTVIHTIDDEDTLNDANNEVVGAWNDYVDIYFGIHKLPVETKVEDFYINEEDVEYFMNTIIKLLPAVRKYSMTLSNILEPAKTKVNDVVNDFFIKYNI